MRSIGNGATALQVRIGRKYDQPVREGLSAGFRACGRSRPRPTTSRAGSSAASRPGGHQATTASSVSAVPLDGGRTFMHLSYSYGYGMAGRLAMQAYLATAGADKVGFTVTGKDGNGQPIYIGGMRGAIERNVMRYYLAIDAHLASLRSPPDQQVEKTIQTWFDATERYPRQLREMDRSDLRRDEARRVRAPADADRIAELT